MVDPQQSYSLIIELKTSVCSETNVFFHTQSDDWYEAYQKAFFSLKD